MANCPIDTFDISEQITMDILASELALYTIIYSFGMECHSLKLPCGIESVPLSIGSWLTLFR